MPPLRTRKPLCFQALTVRGKLARALWQVVWLLLFRPSPVPLHAWRRFLLRLFGATIEARTTPYPSVRVWAPWNLTMRMHSCLGPYVDCYCVDKVELGRHVTVSQYSFLCTATHDFRKKGMPLITAPIVIQDHAWITADAFIGPGVTIGQGSVIGARSVVTRDTDPWTVVAGIPGRAIGPRDPSVASD